MGNLKAALVVICSILIVNETVARADLTIEKLSDSTVDPSALTIKGIFGDAINGQAFQQDVLDTLNGYQYLAYYDGQRHVCVARRKSGVDTWEIARLTDYQYQGKDGQKGDDAHNTISMGVCPRDGTIHLAFDHHGRPLNYRVSKPGVALHPADVAWSPDVFGAITRRLDRDIPSVTYPGFLVTPDNGLQFVFRSGTSGNGDRNISTYIPGDATTPGKWANTHPIDSGKGDFTDDVNTSHARCSYPNSYTYGPDGKLHVTWVWRENTQGANHDLCYSYSDDAGKTWKNNAGDIVGTVDGSKRINILTPGITVWPITRKQSVMNTQGQAVDSKGHIHSVMWYKKDAVPFVKDLWWTPTKASYFHFWRDDAGKWTRTEIPSPVGNRPQLFFDKNDNAILVYTTNRHPDAWQAGIYYTAGELTIAAATAGSKWTDWKIIHKEPGDYLNEVLGDPSRIAKDGVLSLMMQATPEKDSAPSAIKVLEFKIKN